MRRSLREENAAATRAAILAAARQLFTAKGYDRASIDDIAAAAQVTSGALYHHFQSKREIMRAVFELLDQELVDRVNGASRGARGAAEIMRQSLETLFDAYVEDDFRALVFQQSMRVLGWEEWRAIDQRLSIDTAVSFSERLRRERPIAKFNDRLLASFLLAVTNEAGLQISLNPQDRSLRQESEQIIEAFLRGLELSPQQQQRHRPARKTR